MATETPTYPQFTNTALGEGLFDQLMAAAKKHIMEEWNEQRINGDTYAKVYLGMMETVLGNTTQYLLGLLLIDEKADKLQAEIDLIREQIRQMAYETDFILPAQRDKILAEIELINAQIAKINKEIEFLDAKILSELANTDETIADAGSLIGRQINLLRIQGLGFAGDLEAKATKLHADYDSVFQSVQEVPEASTLSQNAVNGIIGILQTVEKMKDDAYVDPVFTPPTVVTPP